jgi:hypothetical protein
MKNIAKLTLFFSFVFVSLFVVVVLLGLLSSWIDLARKILPGTGLGEDLVEAAWKAIPAALYFSILLALNYSARQHIPIPKTIICLFILGCVFTTVVFLGTRRAEALQPVFKPVPPIQGEPGLILSRSDIVTVLLKESGDINGPRLVSIPGQPLIYQEAPRGPNNTILELPALPFGNETPWFLRSVGIDFSISAAEMKGRQAESYFSFSIYAFSLILLLVSLRFLLEFSQWPLANLFVGILIFRLILSLEIFLDAREINAIIGSFLNKWVPPSLITPLIFGALAVLFILFTLLTRISRSAGSTQGDDYD